MGLPKAGEAGFWVGEAMGSVSLPLTKTHHSPKELMRTAGYSLLEHMRNKRGILDKIKVTPVT
jgi:hypothetical protein